MLNLILFGPPGAGKGTQSKLLAEKYNLVHLSTGDLLRSEISNGTALGMEAKSLIDAGKLVPDSVVVGMVQNKVENNLGAEGFIFDGFPRTTEQAIALDKILGEHNAPISLVLALDVDEDELTRRMLERGRKDDTEAVIRDRFKVYEKETYPLKKYYQRHDKFSEVYGLGTVDEVSERLQNAIETVNG